MAVDRWYFSQSGAERPDEHEAGDGDEYFEKYATALLEKAAGRVLDIGCGHGYLTRRLAQKSEVSEVVAIDKIQDFSFENDKIKFQSADFSKNYYLPQGFDTIVSSEFIEHLAEEDYRALLSEITKSLHPEGKYLGSTPLNPTPYKVFSGSRFHLREYNKKDLENILREYFENVFVAPLSEYCLFWEASHPRT